MPVLARSAPQSALAYAQSSTALPVARPLRALRRHTNGYRGLRATRGAAPISLRSTRRVTVRCASEASVSVPEAAVNKGLELFDKGSYQQAIAEFDRALSLDPNDEEGKAAHYNKACAQLKLGQEEAAIASLRSALEFGLNFNTILSVSHVQDCQNTFIGLLEITVTDSPGLIWAHRTVTWPLYVLPPHSML